MIENSPSGQIFMKYEQVEKNSNFVVFILNHYALMLRYFMMPKKTSVTQMVNAGFIRYVAIIFSRTRF